MLTCRALTFVILFTLAATLLAGDEANNPHDLKTLAARQAWISLQRDLEKLDAQYQRDRQTRINKAIIELETAKAKAAQAANADEIVRIGKATSDLRDDIASDDPLVNSTWHWGPDGTETLRFLVDHKTSTNLRWSRLDEHRVALIYPNGAIDILVFDQTDRAFAMFLGPRENAIPVHQLSRR